MAGARASQIAVGLLLLLALALAGLALQEAGSPDWWPTQAPSAVLPGLG